MNAILINSSGSNALNILKTGKQGWRPVFIIAAALQTPIIQHSANRTLPTAPHRCMLIKHL